PAGTTVVVLGRAVAVTAPAPNRAARPSAPSQRAVRGGSGYVRLRVGARSSGVPRSGGCGGVRVCCRVVLVGIEGGASVVGSSRPRGGTAVSSPRRGTVRW